MYCAPQQEARHELAEPIARERGERLAPRVQVRGMHDVDGCFTVEGPLGNGIEKQVLAVPRCDTIVFPNLRTQDVVLSISVCCEELSPVAGPLAVEVPVAGLTGDSGRKRYDWSACDERLDECWCRVSGEMLGQLETKRQVEESQARTAARGQAVGSSHGRRSVLHVDTEVRLIAPNAANHDPSPHPTSSTDSGPTKATSIVRQRRPLPGLSRARNPADAVHSRLVPTTRAEQTRAWVVDKRRAKWEVIVIGQQMRRHVIIPLQRKLLFAERAESTPMVAASHRQPG